MTGMAMAHQTWYGAAAGYLGMWMAMMAPMMLPSVVPMLSGYRRSVRGADGIHLHALTAVVVLGYFAVWAVVGVAVHGGGAALMAVETRWGLEHWLPVAAVAGLFAAGGVQLSSWKARQLALCRQDSVRGCPLGPSIVEAWRHGLERGVRCSLSCGSLMLALLAIGMMDLVAMAAVTVAISAERLVPAPARVVRAAGIAIVVVGVLMIARV